MSELRNLVAETHSYQASDEEKCSNNSEIYVTNVYNQTSALNRKLQLVASFSFLALVYLSCLGHTVLNEIRQQYRTNSNNINSREKNVIFGDRLSERYKSSEHQVINPSARKLKNGVEILIVIPKGEHPHSLLMAEEVKRGVLEYCSVEQLDLETGKVQVNIHTTETADSSHIITSDAIILGSPVYNANVHPDLQTWINTWDINLDFSQKIGSAFVTAGGMSAGEETTLMGLLRSMLTFNMIVIGGDSWTAPFGASAVLDEPPFGIFENDANDDNIFNFKKECYELKNSDGVYIHPMFLEKAFGQGKRIGKIVHLFHGDL